MNIRTSSRSIFVLFPFTVLGLCLLGVAATPVQAQEQVRRPAATTVEDAGVAPEVKARLDAALAEADRLRQADELSEARTRYEALARDAEQALARQHQATALSQLGRTLLALRQQAEARKAIDRAIALFQDLHDVEGLAGAYGALAQALESGPEKDAIIERARRTAIDAGDRAAECAAIQAWGDDRFAASEYAAAEPKLQEALACFARLDDPSAQAPALVGLARVQQAHAQYQASLDYFTRALALQEARLSDGRPSLATIQTRSLMGNSYLQMGRLDEARAQYERVLADARLLKSEYWITMGTGQLGSCYMAQREWRKAIPLIEIALERADRPAQKTARTRQLARAYMWLQDLPRAQLYADRAVELARTVNADLLTHTLHARAEIARQRGALDVAERDIREAIGLVEEARAKAVPIDFMKRGYTDIDQVLFGSAIEIFMKQGRATLALETAERARGRAFLDLLATRNTAAGTGRLAARTAAPALSSTDTRVAGPGASRAETTTRGASQSMGSALPERGESAVGGSAPGDAGVPGTPDGRLALESRALAPAATIGEMAATAKRLRSTLLAYWVLEHGLFAWVVSPRGEVHGTRIDVKSAQLDKLVADAHETMAAVGGGAAFGSAAQTRAWRGLYRHLIAPIRAHLPSAPDSLLTIAPHGPLFAVSFAALQDDQGRYLVERYRIHYTPAFGVLQFTTTRRAANAQAPVQALLVGDPGPLTPEPGGEALAALPWARREVAEIAAQMEAASRPASGPRATAAADATGAGHPAAQARVLLDADASEASVRAHLEGMDLLHFATHGVVRQQESLSSFLALRGTATGADGSAGTGTGRGTAGNTGGGDDGAVAAAGVVAGGDHTTDGRLTADEVYGLNLRARLVVLSACSTARGPTSGDGVIGFTRAFLYAGAASVIATEWDVPDEAGYELMRRFYRSRAQRRDGHQTESHALRAAQLRVIDALRKGQLKVTTPGGEVALPEHPLFWAGFVLVGEP